jgi:quercetin dioxygenase-like cupin family protein
MEPLVCRDWQERVSFSAAGPQPYIFAETDKIKVVLVGLEPGQKLPPHPAPQGVYHFLAGNGWMIVDGQRVAVAAGSTVVVPNGASRGVEAETRLAFIGSREA